MSRSFVRGGLAVVVLMLATSAAAQTFSGGIKVGGNSSTLPTFPAGGPAQRRTGLAIGVFITKKLAPGLAFQPEVLFSQEGATARGTIGTTTIEVVAKLDYIRVPLLLRIGRAAKSGVYVVAGPGFGMLISATAEAPGQPTINFKSVSRSVDLNVVAGVGLNASHLLVEGRYSASVTDVDKGAPATPSKGTVFTVLIGVRF